MHDINIPSAYTLIRRETIPDVQSEGYLLRHNKSGARVMLLDNEDDNKVFCIGFRTTPKDSTGVAHIMEHSVLCGSRKFPSKDPFVELAKGSMNTFLNAMTYPDKTIYPVASCNDRDLANLMDVYMDAVFYPNIYRKEEIFRQEGWSYQLENEEDELVYNGVVYNEMKGAFSSPDDVVEREIMNSLFPDTTYHHESGGDPAVIPELSYEAFLDFHRTYYHPSNSYIYLYGDMDFAERLSWLDEAYLSRFDAEEVDSRIGLQKPFEEMVKVTKSYPIGNEEEEKDNTYLTWNAVVGTSLDTRLSATFAVLDYALLGMPGAPLKQALLDAGIGKDILSSYDSGTYQPVFSVIAKNANEEDGEAFLRIIRDTLGAIAREGVDEKALLAAINMMDFRFREADYGTFPKGLMYGIDAYDSWLYDDDAPFDYLRQLDDFAFLREKIGSGYFEDVIRKYFLENSHVSFLVLKPERGMTARMEKETAEALKRYRDSLTAEEIGVLIENTKKLRAFQETPSTQEELVTIPLLGREDLGREARPLKNEVTRLDGAYFVHHDYATNGIAYIRIALDASDVPAEDLPWLGLLRSVLGFVDTKQYSYTDLFNEINLHTGGITFAASVIADQNDSSRARLALSASIRTLCEKIGYCFDMVEEILFCSDLGSDKRLLEILQKDVSRTKTRLSESGSATALSRSLSGLSTAYRLNESMSGIRFLDAVRYAAEHFEEEKENVRAALRRTIDCVISSGGLLVSYTGDPSECGYIQERTVRLAEKLRGYLGMKDMKEQNVRKPAEDVMQVLRDYPGLKSEALNEGILTPAKVQYVAKTGNFRKAGFAWTGALRVLRTIMSYEYLWGLVRVVGGAYGCSAVFSRNGDTGWASYRDPQLKKTLEVYDGIPEYLENFECSDRDMTKYVIGTIGEVETPLTPSALGLRSLTALLGGVTEEMLQKELEEILDADQEAIRALAPLAKAVLEQEHICVVGNENRLKEEKELFDTLREL